MFQSLFQWIYLCNYSAQQIPHMQNVVSILVLVDLSLQHSLSLSSPVTSHSFNPCFRGFISATISVSAGEMSGIMFQSLFQWIYLCNTSGAWATNDAAGFQSLFQWIYLCNQSSITSHPHTLCFNPCFSGFISATVRTLCCGVAGIRVSILVLVDLSLQLHLCED